MNTTFKIPYKNTDAPNNVVIEIGACNVSIFCYSTFPFTATGFYYYTITDNDTTSTIASELKTILVNENLTAALVDKVHIFYNYAESTFVPSAYFKTAEVDNIAALMFGNKMASVNLHETLDVQKIENVYAVPAEIKMAMEAIFPNARASHSLCKAIQNANGTKLFSTVYDKEIRIVLFKENTFMLAAYFDYTTPEDVCYHMLNACERYAVSPADVDVVLNGMIDTNSNLYKEMYKFFIQLHIENLPEKVQLADGFEEIASHYFSPLVKLAKCVS
jgi:Protein of unknown function (DUF3822)